MTKHIVYLSGGIASYFAARRVVDLYGASNTILLYTDTNMEDRDLYRFLYDCQRDLGVKITWLADGRTPWKVFEDERFIGNTRIDPCSRILKRELARKWLEANYGPDEVVLQFGFDWTEGHRLEALQKHVLPYKAEAPLMEPPLLDRDQMQELLVDRNIEVPRLYKLGFPHNNCGGMCVKAGQAQFGHLLLVDPVRYAEHENAMEQIMAKQPGLRPFLRKNIKGKTHYMTLKEWREYIEAGGTYSKRDFGGCNCFFVEDDFK